MQVVTAILALAIASAAASSQRTASPAMRPVANVVTAGALPHGDAALPEPAGRVVRWQNDRLLAVEAEAAAAVRAAAQAAADQAAAQAAAQARAQAAAVVRSAPRPAPAQPPAAPPSVASGTVQDIITKAFTPYGTTAVAWGLRVARCESGYNPRAYNPAGPYYGLFQFLMSTYRATPYGGQDIYDPVANASAAAWKYGQGGAGAWGCK
jgi:hypothetical protein